MKKLVVLRAPHRYFCLIYPNCFPRLFAVCVTLSTLDAEITDDPIDKTENPIIMKRRFHKIANFFAFNLLFFALYLNFIHKDRLSVAGTPQSTQQNAAFSGTVLVDNPGQVIEKKSDEATATLQETAPAKTIESNTVALKLSVN